MNKKTINSNSKYSTRLMAKKMLSKPTCTSKMIPYSFMISLTIVLLSTMIESHPIEILKIIRAKQMIIQMSKLSDQPMMIKDLGKQILLLLLGNRKWNKLLIKLEMMGCRSTINKFYKLILIYQLHQIKLSNTFSFLIKTQIIMILKILDLL